MTENELVYLTSTLGAIAIALLYLFLRLKSQKENIDNLNTRADRCVSEMLFRLEQDKRRELERRLDALQEHLGLVTVNRPQKTLLVKKGSTEQEP